MKKIAQVELFSAVTEIWKSASFFFDFSVNLDFRRWDFISLVIWRSRLERSEQVRQALAPFLQSERDGSGSAGGRDDLRHRSGWVVGTAAAAATAGPANTSVVVVMVRWSWVMTHGAHVIRKDRRNICRLEKTKNLLSNMHTNKVLYSDSSRKLSLWK